MSRCPVARCAQPTHPGWAICKPCAAGLQKALAEVPALTTELATNLARQSTHGGHNGPRNAERPLPYDRHSSEVAWILHNTLHAWIRDLETHTDRHPIDTMTALAGWLLGHFGRILVHDQAEQAVEEITAATTLAWRTIDNRPERVFLGACPTCGLADIYATLGATNVACRDCGATHDVEELRTALRASLDDHLVTATEYAGMLTVLGIPVERERARTLVNSWAARGRIVTHAGPTYRFGELQTRMAERMERRA